VTLPLFAVPDSELPDSLKRTQMYKKEDTTSADSTGPLESFRVLVVDDTELNRKLLIRLLKNKGHVCDEAENGKVGLELVNESIQRGNPYDTVLLDYEMPVMNGPTAALKMRLSGCDAFIVGITGNIMPADIQRFKGNGANVVLAKPLRMRDLEDAWAEHGVSGSGFGNGSGEITAVDVPAATGG